MSAHKNSHRDSQLPESRNTGKGKFDVFLPKESQDAAQLRPAPLHLRLLAGFVQSLGALALCALVAIASFTLLMGDELKSQSPDAQLDAFGLALIAPLFAYMIWSAVQTWTIHAKGGSWISRKLGMRVVREKATEADDYPSWSAAGFREIVMRWGMGMIVLPAVFAILPYLAIVMAPVLFGKRQSIFDHLASTKVIDVRYLDEAAQPSSERPGS